MSSRHPFIHRLACVFFLSIIGIQTGAQAAAVTIVLPQASASGDTELKVPVLVKGAQGLGPLQMDLLFDSKQLQFIKAAEGSGFGNGLFDSNLLAPGRLRLVMTGDPNKPIQGDVELFLLTFRTNASGAGRSVLAADNLRAWEQTQDGFEMRVTLEPGSVTVSPHSGFIWLSAVGGLMLIVLAVLFRVFQKKAHNTAKSAAAVTETKPASGVRFCPSCGVQVGPAAKFCPSCGKPTSG